MSKKVNCKNCKYQKDYKYDGPDLNLLGLQLCKKPCNDDKCYENFTKGSISCDDFEEKDLDWLKKYLKIKTFKWNEELEYFNKKGDYDDYYYYEGILDLAKAIIKDELEQM